MKKGSDGRKCLHYLDRAVELNDYDEAALVARSRSAGDGAAVIFRYLVNVFVYLLRYC